MSEEGGQRWALAAFDATVDAQGLRREWEEWHRSFELLAEMRNIQSQREAGNDADVRRQRIATDLLQSEASTGGSHTWTSEDTVDATTSSRV